MHSCTIRIFIYDLCFNIHREVKNRMNDLNVPEEVDIWKGLSPKVKMDIVAVCRIRRIPIRRFMAESVLTSIEGSLDSFGIVSNEDYKQERDQLDLIKDD